MSCDRRLAEETNILTLRVSKSFQKRVKLLHVNVCAFAAGQLIEHVKQRTFITQAATQVRLPALTINDNQWRAERTENRYHKNGSSAEKLQKIRRINSFLYEFSQSAQQSGVGTAIKRVAVHMQKILKNL
jgi:hypothetical protein